ncbi:MAG: cysteine--tRNA ligase [Candidatus Kapaibacterium sp.]
MQIKLHNSLTKNIEEFKPIDGSHVRIYSCGPTVYNFAHIGNMRAFLFADLLQRVLKTVGKYSLSWVMNITNIDDKTIRDSAKGSPAWKESLMGPQTDDPMENLNKLTAYYEKAFIEDIEKLGIMRKDFTALPRATDYIEEMQLLIKKIVDRGYGYVSGGSVYFNVAKWRESEVYGKLKKIDFDNFRSGVRIDADQYEREQVSDFVLWKARKEGEPYWEFEINGESCPGRPGWHIECSSMEYKLLGLPFDIHTGGVDLKFPHHEDEIAQSKAGYGVEPTNVWCHNEFLEVEGEKMSKSAGNFFTLRDLTDKGIDPLDIRFAIFSAHYNSKFNFTFDGISAARKSRQRVQEYIYTLLGPESGDKKADVESAKNNIYTELANDLHTPKALAAFFKFINENPAGDITPVSKEQALELLKELNDIFNIWHFELREEKAAIPPEITEMAEKRLEAKKARDFAEADRLRDEITASGFIITDTKDGYQIKKK